MKTVAGNAITGTSANRHGLAIANQRMIEHKLGLSGEPDLIDELACHQVLEHRIDRQRFNKLRLSPEMMSAAALGLRLAFGSRRSTRAPMVACNVAGTLASPTAAADSPPASSGIRDAESLAASNSNNPEPFPYRLRRH